MLFALRSKEDTSTVKASHNKGILLNVEQFDGPIQLIQNHVSDNMVLIPAAIASNNVKFNKTIYDPNVQERFDNHLLTVEKRTYSFLRFQRYSRILGHDITFFNY